MEKIGKKKIIIIAIIAVALIAIAVVAAIFIFDRKEEYRVIKIYELKGEAVITRENNGDIDAYQGMQLQSGDKILFKSGEMTLKLDDDKYVYVEPDTQFRLIAQGNSKNSKTSIELDRGAITNDIKNPLSDKSSYEVNTPNSNMAVRGTVYRVHTYYENGVRYTRVTVFEGKVDSCLIYPDGTKSKDIVIVEKGNEVLIYDDETNTDYVGKPGPIDYESLPEYVIDVLKKIKQSGTDIVIPDVSSKDDPDNNNDGENGPFTVTFMYNGQVFGTQVVDKGAKAAKPKLSPSQTGGWDFDFDKEINEDTTIEWR